MYRNRLAKVGGPRLQPLPDWIDDRQGSRETAVECSPRRKPWVDSGKREAPKSRKSGGKGRSDASHFVSRTHLLCALLMTLLTAVPSSAATKPHIISFGKWMTVDWIPGNNADEKLTLKIRPLIIDTRVKEYVTGAPHEITERLFAVRRVFRVNDSLPEDSMPKWQWQRGGWLLVDRVTGRISPINLPEFDPLYSSASWYRDYVAYCGVSDDGQKTFAMVAQLNRRKPLLKKALAQSVAEDGAPDSACATPEWQRSPARVSFLARGSEKQTFSIRGHIVDFVSDEDEE